MIIQYDRRGATLDETAQQQIEERLRRLEGLLEEPVEVHLAVETRKHSHLADLHVAHRHGKLQAREENEHQLLDAVQEAVEKVVRQARRGRDRQRARRRRPRAEAATAWPVDVVERASLAGGGGRRIIKSSQLQIKPMSIEEAALQLDGSKNDFVVFRDSETDRIAVLYKRRDDHYGLIAPE